MTHPFLSNFNQVDSKVAIELTNIFSDTSYVKGIPTNEQRNDLFIWPNISFFSHEKMQAHAKPFMCNLFQWRKCQETYLLIVCIVKITYTYKYRDKKPSLKFQALRDNYT